MRTVLNVLWLVLSGIWLALGYALAGLVLCLLIVTIPFGVGLLPPCGLRPVAVRAGRRAPPGGGRAVGARQRALVRPRRALDGDRARRPGCLLCLTIIGIPLGLGNFKLAAVAIAPLGKEIVPTSDPRVAAGAIVF